MASRCGGTKCRIIFGIMHQLIWDINSFLLESFHLYEFYLSSQKETESVIKISKSVLGRSKFLCFEHLNQMYKEKPDYSEEEY